MEATMVMLDNSQSSINGDYAPTRWDQQVEASNLLIEGKIADSAQASVGLGIMAGKRVEILCAPTNNSAKLSAYLFGIPIYGEIRLKEAIKTALLAMKNRQNTNQRQRIICVVSSTITDSEQDLARLGKQLKKDAVNIDLVVCGDENLPQFAGQLKRVEAIMEGLKSTESSVLWVPSHIHIRDAIVSSSIFADRGAGGGGAVNVPAAGGGANNEDRIDPNIDPELAMALQASRKEYEEQLKKAEAQSKKDAPPEKKSAQQEQDQDAEMQRRAIELSLQEEALVQAELQKKKKEQEEKSKPKQPESKPQNQSNKDQALGEKHGDFISEFQKMDEQDDQQAKLKKKEEKK